MQVKVYTKPNCSYCISAKYLLFKHKITYTEQVLEKDFTRQLIQETFPTARTYPIIEINGDYIGGYQELVKYLEENKQVLDDGHQLFQE